MRSNFPGGLNSLPDFAKKVLSYLQNKNLFSPVLFVTTAIIFFNSFLSNLAMAMSALHYTKLDWSRCNEICSLLVKIFWENQVK